MRKGNYFFNNYGYFDPTAGLAMKSIHNEEKATKNSIKKTTMNKPSNYNLAWVNPEYVRK